MDEAGRGCPSRASLPTVARSEQPDGDFLQDFEHALDEPKLTWAVDCEGELSALSTFDLWYALNVGSLSRSARVWRVGREAWKPVLEVPELACALRADDAPPVERTTMDYAVKPPAFELASEEPSVPAESPQPSPDVSDDLPPALRRPSAPPGRSSAPPPESRVTRVSVEAVTMPPRSLPPAKPARRRSAWSAMAAGLAFVFGFSAAAMAASAVETPAAPLGSMALLSSIELPAPPDAIAPVEPRAAVEPQPAVAPGGREATVEVADPPAPVAEPSAVAAGAPSASATPLPAKAKLKAKPPQKKTWSPTKRGQKRQRQTAH